MKVDWNLEEELENVDLFGINFSEAKEVILNNASFKIRNIAGDFLYIGPTEDLSKILIVNCIIEDDSKKITFSRLATKKEQDTFFLHLIQGDFK